MLERARRKAGLWLMRAFALGPFEHWMDSNFGGYPTNSGPHVNAETATQASAVYACVQFLSGTIASLPAYVFRKGRINERWEDHPLHSVIHDRANAEMTAFEFWERVVWDLELQGNAYAEKELDRRGRVIGLHPLAPGRMTVARVNGRLRYLYRFWTGEESAIPADRLMHLRLACTNGITGLSRIGIARETIGLALATQEHGAGLFKNGANPGGVITMNGELSPEAEARFLRKWNEAHQGSQNAGRVTLLYADAKYQPVTMTANDAQWIESRKFQTQEIARIFGVAPHIIGDLERSTNNNIEQQSLETTIYTLRSRLKRIEQKANICLLGAEEQRRAHIEFEVDALLRGDYKTRMEGHSTAIQSGIKTPNEARGQENLPPVEGGDVLLVPLNMVPAQSAGAMRTQEKGQRAKGKGQKEIRKAGEERLRLREQYHGLFLAEAERVVRGEIREVKQALDREFERGANEFADWIETYYWGRNIGESEFVKFYAGRMDPVEASYALAIARAAAEESGLKEISLEDYVQAHVRASGKVHAGRSAAQLRALLKEHGAESVVEEIQKRMAEWQEKRPGKMAAERVSQSDGAYAREFWRRSGVRELRWHTVGESCPLCRQLAGKVVGIEGAFLPQGESLEAEGTSPLWAGSDVTHPPLHTGCNCYITAG